MNISVPKHRKFLTNSTLTATFHDKFGSDGPLNQNDLYENVENLVRTDIPLSAFAQMDLEELRKRETNFSFIIFNTNGSVTSRNLRYTSQTLIKKIAIKANSARDSMIGMSEINLLSSDASLLKSHYAQNGQSCIKDCSEIDYSELKGQRTTKFKGFKSQGYGTAILHKDNRGSWIENANIMNDTKMPFEIVARIVHIGEGITGLCCTFYRSPSMTHIPEIIQFYETLYNIYRHTKNANPNLNFYIYCGDDNSTSDPVATISKKTFEEKMNMSNLIGEKSTRYDKHRKRHYQPDSCYGSADFIFARLDAQILPKITSTMDHLPIRINVTCDNIAPRIPLYRTIIRKTRCRSDKQISDWLERELGFFTQKFRPLLTIYHNSIENDNEIYKHKISEKTVDFATDQLLDIFERVKEYAWHSVSVKVADTVREDERHCHVLINQQYAVIEKMTNKFTKLKVFSNEYNEEKTLLIAA